MMKKRLVSVLCAFALAIGLLPTAALAAPAISTDVVIHKMEVASGTGLESHNGEEITNFTGTNLEGATPMQGIIFKYWKIADSATSAQMSAIKALSTIADIEAYATANPTILTGGTETAATSVAGTVTVAGLAEGKYIFGEVNGASNNVSEYIGVPFLLELPAMKASGTEYFGTGANALHVYPKNALENPGLDFENVDEKTLVRIGGGSFRVELYNSGTDSYETVGSIGASGIITLANGVITLADLPAGHYQLVNTIAPGGYMLDNRPVKFEVSAGNVIFNTVGNNPKASFTAGTSTDNPMITLAFEKKPAVTKTEGNGGTERVGETVTWTVSLEVPASIDEYLVFKMTDTIDTRLDFLGTSSITATVDGAALTLGTHYTVDFNTTSRIMSVEFAPASLGSYAGKTIVVTYGTKINETALMGQEIPNDVNLDFDNGHGSVSTPGDPYNPPIKPPVTPTVWTGGAKFLKVDGSNNTVVLPGAEFKIASDAAGTIFLTWTQDLMDANDLSKFKNPAPGAEIVMVSGSDGVFEIKGLKGGDYYLVETKAPNHNGTQYNLLRDPAKFTITKTSYEDTSKMTVQNNSGLEIPQTGGIGTVIFTLAGIALMGVAVFLFRKKKATQSE